MKGQAFSKQILKQVHDATKTASERATAAGASRSVAAAAGRAAGSAVQEGLLAFVSRGQELSPPPSADATRAPPAPKWAAMAAARPSFSEADFDWSPGSNQNVHQAIT